MDMEQIETADVADISGSEISIQDKIESTATRVDLSKDQKPDAIRGADDVIPAKKEKEVAEAPTIDFSDKKVEEPKEEEVPPYQPDLKFRVGQKEHEIEEWARSAIKDPETNKKVKDFFERAYGIDLVKDHRDKLQHTNAELKGQIEDFNGNLNTLREYVQKGHFEDFFQALGIPEQRAIQWAANRVKYYEMDPMQKGLIDAEREARLQNRQLSQEKTHYETEAQQAMVQLREQQLDFELSRPDIAEAITQYDSYRGPGAFRNEVIQRGAIKYQMEKVDVPPQKLVREVMDILRLNPQVNTGATERPGGGAYSAPTQKPVLPNVKGTAGSPTRKMPKSIDDLRAEAKRRIAAEG